jgi:hypothetical protein
MENPGHAILDPEWFKPSSLESDRFEPGPLELAVKKAIEQAKRKHGDRLHAYSLTRNLCSNAKGNG